MLLPFVLATPVKSDAYIAIGQCAKRAREACGLKQATVGSLMGDLSGQAIEQMERGERRFQEERLSAMTSDPDGQRFVAAYMAERAAMLGVEDLDGIAQRLLALTREVITRRMARASLRSSSLTRRSA